MALRFSVFAGACIALGAAVRPAAREPQALRTEEHKAANATLTAEESKTLDSAAECGLDMNESYAQVEAAVGTANSSATAFLDSVTSAIGTASDALLAAQSAASAALAIIGTDDSALSDLVDAVTTKATTVLTVVNDTNDNLKAFLADVLGQYREQMDSINESLTEAISSAEEAALADAEKADAEAAANASKNETLVARPRAFRGKYTVAADLTGRLAIVAASPKLDATRAIAKMNSTADTVIDMLTQLNDTLISAVSSDVIDQVNSSAQSMQATLLGGMDKLPFDVPDKVAAKMNGLFDKVFAAIDSISPQKVNAAMAPNIAAATKNVADFQSCIQPLGQMVDDLDSASLVGCSWSMLGALAAVSVSRALQ